MNRCLRRLMGSRRMFSRYESASNTVAAVIPTSVNAFLGLKSFGSGSVSQESWENEHVKSLLYHPSEEAAAAKGREEKQLLQKGDIVDLSQILFSKNRDYLIKYNHPQLVTADQLAGKVIVLYFVRHHPYFTRSGGEIVMTSLIDVYNDFKDKSCFEVVFVFLDHARGDIKNKNDFICPVQLFENIFSRMPWTAIPLSDVTSRKFVEHIFGLLLSAEPIDPTAIVVDSTGKILQTSCEDIIDMYGTPGYPFSDERLALLDSEYEAVVKQPSLTTLLVSPERDYVISNKGEKVHIESLEDKVVALYFYEDCTSRSNPTEELIVAYRELAENNISFEVVLIYLTDTYDTYKCTNEDTFKEAFKTMPWLALPFKDPVIKKLKRLFDYPPVEHSDPPRKAPSIVIVGPHGEYIEPCGAEVLLNFGVSAYPFTRENLVNLETKGVMDLELEMMCSPTTVFRRIDGSQVKFSHFLGKRVIFYCESAYWEEFEDLATAKEFKYLKMLKEIEFVKMLKRRYLKMKGTHQEFEVIYVPCDNFLYNKRVADKSWFVSPVSELEPGGSAFLTYYGKLFTEYAWSFLLAFGGDGKLVRRTVNPIFKHVDFPFYGGTLEDEAYYKLNRHFFSAEYWNRHYKGLLRNSFNKF